MQPTRTTTALAAFATLAALGLAAAPAQAQAPFVEAGDAGQTLGTAQDASTVTFTQIDGTFASPSDADLYRIYISNPATFSATTVNSTTDAGGVDTEMSLFDASGHGLAVNDDTNGFTFDSTLPAGSALYKNLAAGYYYLGITSSGNSAVNANNQLIFNTYTGGDTTSVRGPASGLNPTTLFNFNTQGADIATAGPYEIDFTGISAAPAAAPEPSQFAAFAIGALGLAALSLRARRP